MSCDEDDDVGNDVAAGNVFAGEEARDATADLLLERLKQDSRTERFFSAQNAKVVSHRLRGFLEGAFDGKWPAVNVDGDLIERAASKLASALTDALQRPLPLGEDAMTAAIRVVDKEMQSDPRIVQLFDEIRGAASTMDDGQSDAWPESRKSRTSRRSSASGFSAPGEQGSAREEFEQLDEEPPANVDEAEAQEEEEEDNADAFLDNESAVSGELHGERDDDINVRSFEELEMPEQMWQEVQGAWKAFLDQAASREAAGEAIYAAVFDSAPSLQSLFKTPRAVMAMRFMNGLANIVHALSDPKQLKIVIETLGFQHLNLEVTVPRVVIFRDALLDLMEAEIGARFTTLAQEGWTQMLNYVGGAYIYVRLKYSDRLRILATSWATANNKVVYEAAVEGEEASGDAAEGEDGGGEGREGKAMNTDLIAAVAEQNGNKGDSTSSRGKDRKRGGLLNMAMLRKDKKGSSNSSGDHGGDQGQGNLSKNTSVPTTYNEMFLFNAAVMGFGNNLWMKEVLMSFDVIVNNVSNSTRLQEECDVLALRIAKCRGPVNLPEYKAVMLASLRSLVPKDWNSNHEVAWGWLWENVERMLKALMGKPAAQQQALSRFVSSLDESRQMSLRKEVYQKFFTQAPAGQDHFKQSTTRLFFIADKVVEMTMEIYKDPRGVVEFLSALGLRHVGYGIPTELFGPFVTAWIEVVRSMTDDDAAEEAFRWSVGLVSRILVRTITEGSTIVMKAINVNSGKQMRKAISCAPRGKRALWMLNVQVGTQSISPLMWAIQSGSLEAANAIITDLLVIRADRDRYYYGLDQLFERHPDIIQRLVADAPTLIPSLLDGLIWRSRLTESGRRRVNYYVKHLLLDSEGEFSQAMQWIAEAKDPKVVCHPVLVLVSDMVWGGLAYRSFLIGKLWFLFNLCVFIISQSILERLHRGVTADRVAIAVCRAFIYTSSLTRLTSTQLGSMVSNIRDRNFHYLACIPIPKYLTDWQDATSFILTIVLMLLLCNEPILYCLNDWHGDFEGNGIFTEDCPAAHSHHFVYSVLSMVAIGCYFTLLVDLSVVSTRISAFVLMCGQVLPELGLFLLALAFTLLMCSSAVTSLDHDVRAFGNIPSSFLALYRMTVKMYHDEDYGDLDMHPFLLISIIFFIIAAVIFLLNLLVAQLNCAYQAIYEDMVGWARLSRMELICETMPSVSQRRWESWVAALRLETPLEFNEGDIGLAGGVQVWELSNEHPTTIDTIRRYGGSTSPTMQWPAEDMAGDEDDDRLERMEKMIQKTMKRMPKSGKSGKHKNGSSSGSVRSGSSASSGGSESSL